MVLNAVPMGQNDGDKPVKNICINQIKPLHKWRLKRGAEQSNPWPEDEPGHGEQRRMKGTTGMDDPTEPSQGWALSTSAGSGVPTRVFVLHGGRMEGTEFCGAKTQHSHCSAAAGEAFFI